MQPLPPSSYLVVIGASAGGIDALSRLVATLPDDFPAPILVAQHLDPTRVSALQALLERTSTLPVRTVTEHAPLTPGVVHVVPASQHVVVTDHDVRLLSTPDSEPAPSIDLLFASAAEKFGEGTIAVILSGMGADGADGARAVKEAGGAVVIQSPETAAYPSMPLSLPPPIVDISVDLAVLGPLLYDLVTGRYTPPPPDADRRMRTLLAQLQAQSGIDFAVYKPPTILRRLQRRMADTGAERLEDYLTYLQQHPEEFGRLAASFLIKVTSFFRDTDVFAYLRDTVLPDLLAAAREQHREVRVWSAGCATGEEAYSLAMLLADEVSADPEAPAIRVFATDADAAAVAFARRGLYPASALDSLPPGLRDRYFTQVDGAYEVSPSVRRLVVFGQHDLGQRAPFPRIDLVLCRNVLIYFTPELQRRVLQLFAFSLRAGGRLVLGTSESTGPLAEYFALEQPRLKIYRRQGEQIVLPAALLPDRASLTPAARPPSPGRMDAGGVPDPLLPSGPRRIAVQAELTLQSLPVGVVTLNRQYDIEGINPSARRLLGIHGTALGQDLIHLAERLPPGRLRPVLDAAFRGETVSESFELPSILAAPGAMLHLALTALPLVSGGAFPADDPAPVETVVVVVRDESAAREEQQRLSRALEAAQADAGRLTALLAEARQEARTLLTANQELSILMSTLQAQNEELQVSNEEAQAAAEEIETLNEEQQATNEELETLNEELQATVEELNTTNEDRSARQAELEGELLAAHTERSRLAALVSGLTDAIAILDRSANIVLTNAAFSALFGGDPARSVLYDEAGQQLPPEAGPLARAMRGETAPLRFSRLAADGRREWFEARGGPLAAGTPELGHSVVIRALGTESGTSPSGPP